VHIRFCFQFLFVLLFLIFAFRAVDEAGLGVRQLLNVNKYHIKSNLSTHEDRVAIDVTAIYYKYASSYRFLFGSRKEGRVQLEAAFSPASGSIFPASKCPAGGESQSEGTAVGDSISIVLTHDSPPPLTDGRAPALS